MTPLHLAHGFLLVDIIHLFLEKFEWNIPLKRIIDRIGATERRIREENAKTVPIVEAT